MEIPFKVALESAIVSPSMPAAPLLLFTLKYASRTSMRVILYGFAAFFRLLPLLVGRTELAPLHAPHWLHPLSRTSSLLRGAPPLGIAFALLSLWFISLVTSPLASTPKVPTFHVTVSPRIRPPYMPDTALPVNRLHQSSSRRLLKQFRNWCRPKARCKVAFSSRKRHLSMLSKSLRVFRNCSNNPRF